MELINLTYQYKQYQEEIDQAIRSVLESGQYIMGRAIDELESELKAYVGVKHCIGVSSGTDALLLALKSLDIGPGDEVICVPFTWISPVECVKRLKAKPVLVDIDPETYLMDLDQLEKAITPQTKAIIPVSLYGQMPDFKRIMELAKSQNIAVIEDGAQSFGSEQNGKKSCSMATIGTTSFFPTKPLGCYGDGGAIFTNRDDLAEKMKAIRVHGASKRYSHQYIGQNARLDTLQAAILLAKFPHFQEEISRRFEIGSFFNERLKENFITPKIVSGNTHAFAQYVLRSKERDAIVSQLQENKIPSAIYYPKCIHLQPAYADLGYERGSFPNSELVADEVFSIPMHPFLTEDDQNKIIKVLNDAVLQKI
ncbi:MAG: UDP-2-acetamido-2-deoxy-3-oxo-D-glucuronate aminotransferase [Chlamydiae bacterium]|nr:UDP-2-acetamido-2-deoxy-3-oxo-D-glucuronate aminotransferase [Chlamydiota bacterium]